MKRPQEMSDSELATEKDAAWKALNDLIASDKPHEQERAQMHELEMEYADRGVARIRVDKRRFRAPSES